VLPRHGARGSPAIARAVLPGLAGIGVRPMAAEQPDLFPNDANTGHIRADEPDRDRSGGTVGNPLDKPERGESYPKPPDDEKVVIVDRPDSPDVGVAELKQQLDILQSEQRRDREEREAEARAMQAAQQVHAQRVQVEQAYQQEAARVAELAKAAAEHTERGEFETAERARIEQQKHIARQRQLEDAHRYLQQAQQQPQAEIDWTRPWSGAETEAFLKGRTKPTADWVRAHPEFARDPAFRDRVTAVDGYVTKVRGIERDTPEYFEAVEREIGLHGDRDDDDGGGHVSYAPAPARSPTTSASSSQSRSSPAYAAPVTRSPAPSRHTQNNGTVTLSPQEREMARNLFNGPAYKGQDPDLIYARQKAILVREGKIGPGTRDGR
jgi:hypothetical protein